MSIDQINPELIEIIYVRPEEFFGRAQIADKRQKEATLMWAVLTDCISRLQINWVKTSNRARRQVLEEEQWLFSNEDEWPCSFLNICDIFGINPSYLREGIMRWKGKLMSGKGAHVEMRRVRRHRRLRDAYENIAV